MELKKVYMQAKNDCYSACLATVLRKELHEIPRFILDGEDSVSSHEKFNERVDEFLATLGIRRLIFPISYEVIHVFKGYHIVSGPSTDPEFAKLGYFHATVFKDGKLWHDPSTAENKKEIEVKEIDLLIYAPDLLKISK